MSDEAQPGGAPPFVRERRIEHTLGPYFPSLRGFRTRRELLASALWREIGPGVLRVLGGVDRADHPMALATAMAKATATATTRSGDARDPDRLRVVAWNIRRGIRFEGLRSALLHDPVLSGADVLLLSEVDLGLGRSGNRHVARELAESLGMSYAFAVSYLTLGDDFGENPQRAENREALAGQAILSRIPLGEVRSVDLPELRDKFSSSEKRLGKKRAIYAELSWAGRTLPVAAVHLDSNASPRQRALQLAAVLDVAEARRPAGAEADSPLLLGGDLNTHTWDTSSTGALLRDLLRKFFVTGFRATVENYLTPERMFETPVFETLRAHHLRIEGYNERGAAPLKSHLAPGGAGTRGTVNYDLNDAYAIQLVRKKVGGVLTRALQRSLRPWGGVVGARLDWFAGRGLVPCGCYVVEARESSGLPISDHAAIVVDLARPDDPAPALTDGSAAERIG